jgi:HK97 gp10 family phage protein
MATAVKWYGDQFLKEVHALMEIKLDAAAEMIVQAAKDSMREAKTGEDVQRNSKGNRTAKRTVSFTTGEGKAVNFRASQRGFKTRRSAPGEAPAVQTARLLRSLTWQRAGVMVRRAGTNVQYAVPLELGSSKMAARPFLRPAMDKCKTGVKRLVTNG